MSCQGKIEAHHLLKPKSGFRGFSLKAHDSECIPLCRFHHSQLHVKFGDEFKFFEYYGFRKTAGQEYAEQLWEGNQNWFEDENDLPF